MYNVGYQDALVKLGLSDDLIKEVMLRTVKSTGEAGKQNLMNAGTLMRDRMDKTPNVLQRLLGMARAKEPTLRNISPKAGLSHIQDMYANMAHDAKFGSPL